MRDLPGGFGGDDGFGGNFGLDGQLSFGGGLPTDQWGLLCNTHPDGCDCPPGPRAVVQNLDELDFTRSACAAAQSGDVNKLERILKRNPEAVHSDGSKGVVMGAWGVCVTYDCGGAVHATTRPCTGTKLHLL